MTTQRTADEIKDAVRERYGSRAREQLGKTEVIELTATSGGGEDCCGPSEAPNEESSAWADKLYSAQELGTVPEEVSALSLGCGNPMAIAELKPGEAVLDLGSGSGLDCFLAAQQVGGTGKVVGLDMTDSMLELAARNLKKVGATNVTFQKGEMESMPHSTRKSANSGYWLGACPQIPTVAPARCASAIRVRMKVLTASFRSSNR